MHSAKLTTFLVIFLLLGVPIISTQANSNGKYNSTSGCSCHSQQSGSAPTPNHNFPLTFNPGQTYSLSIGMTGGVSGTKGGFNLEVSDGTLSTGIGLMNVKVNSAGNQATHSLSNDRSWAVDWMAPSSSISSVTFSLAVLAANGNSQNNGDSWAVTTHTSTQISSENNPPEVSNASLNPTMPTKETGIELLYDYFDLDGDAESGTEISWTVNGDLSAELNNLTIIDSEYLNKGDEITVEIKPNDGIEFGDVVSVGPVTVLNSIPSITDLVILPENPLDTDSLSIDYTFMDEDNDIEQYSMIYWYLNDIRQLELDNSTEIGSVVVRAEDRWKASVTPFDGDDFGDIFWTDEITISSSNNPPLVNVGIIGNGITNTTENLELSIDATDPDGDPVLFTEIFWYKDGEIVSELNNQEVIDFSRTSKGETWFAEVRVSDGVTWSTWESGGNYTIVNSPPSVSDILIISESTFVTNQNLTVVWEQFDLDGDSEINSEIIWWLNGERISRLDGLQEIPFSETYRGQKWKVGVRPSDGENFGDLATSDEITIRNSEPTISQINIVSKDAEDGIQYSLNDLILEVESNDLDGDILSYNVNWSRNGFLVADLNNLWTIPDSLLEPGQIWSVLVSVFDEMGYNSSSSLSMEIGNINPSAEWTRNQTPISGTKILFDGSTSEDEDGEIVEWFWNIGGIEKTGSMLEVVLGNGEHIIGLTVIDDMGGIDTKTEIIKLGFPETVESLTASIDGDIAILEWNWNDENTNFKIYRSSSPFSINTEEKQLLFMDSRYLSNLDLNYLVGETNITTWSEQIPVSSKIYYAVTAVTDNQEIILIYGNENTVTVDATNISTEIDDEDNAANPSLSIPSSIVLLFMGIISIFLNINWKGDNDEK